jgi:hypothetical protein
MQRALSHCGKVVFQNWVAAGRKNASLSLQCDNSSKVFSVP